MPNPLWQQDPIPGTRANALAPSPTWADAYEYNKPVVQQYLADTGDRLQDPKWWVDAGHQYVNAMLMGTTAPGARVGGMTPIEHMLEQIRADPKAKWGLRVVPDPIEGGPGSVLPPSRVWNDGKPTDKLLNGTSTVGINGVSQKHLEAALKQAGILPYGENPSVGYYIGEHVALVKGQTAARGYDDLERIIPNAQVVSVYRKANDGRSALLPMDDGGGAAAAGAQ